MRPVLLTALLAFIFLAVFYHSILLAPNQTFFSLQGDGLKNYFTFLYHVRHDGKYLHFDGLNYPYGEHLFYTDAQPLPANALKWISSHVVDLAPYAVAILNLTLLLALVPASMVLYLILRKFRLPPWYAVPAAVGITFLSPQVLRIGGHYSLGYVLAIPLAWYLSLRFFENATLCRGEPVARPWSSSSFLIVLNSLLWSAIHPYYLYISSLFLLVLWTINYRRIQIAHKTTHALIQIFLPGLLLGFWILASDPHLSQRPGQLNYGYYRASPASVFLPSYPTFGIDSDWLVHWGQPQSEGIAYIGVAGLLGLLVLGITFFNYSRRGRVREILRPTGIPLLNSSLIAAVVLLVFSFGFPFRMSPELLLQSMSPLAQFRAIGRFAWVFYYVFSVFALYLVFVAARWLTLRTSRKWSNLLLAVALTGLLAEAAMQNRTLSKYIDNRCIELYQGSPGTAWIDKIDVEKYQAIVPLPYYHLGSDKIFSYPGTRSSVFNSMMASLRTGLPLTSVFLARTSIEHTRRSVAFFDRSNRESILTDLPNEKPLLILATHDPLKPEEAAILSRASLLFQNKAVRVYELKISTGS